MSEVLIIARTHMKHGNICLAGIEIPTARLIRLMTRYGSYYTENAPFRPRQVWEITYEPRRFLTPPHVEDVCVQNCRNLGEGTDIYALLTNAACLIDGSPTRLLQGRLTFGKPVNRHTHPDEATPTIDRGESIPSQSLALWRTDRVLTKRTLRSAVYYLAPRPRQNEVSFKVKYTGFEGTPILIPEGSYLSLSLARWWDRDDRGEAWERCHLQLCDILWNPTH